jgi:tetratricopeptide (TPR) repeat protein
MERIKLLKASVAILVLLVITQYGLSQVGRGEGRITGKIQSEDGRPLQKAAVKAISLVHQAVVLETRSDEKGEWVILGLGTGTWRVEASAEGYYAASQDVNVKQLERNPEINIALKKLEQTDLPTIQDTSSFVLFEQGNLLFSEKKYDEAISSYRQFLQANPKAYQIHFNIGNACKEQGELEKAREEYELVMAGIKGESGDMSGNELAAKTLAALGETYLKENNIEEAQKYFKNSIEIFPKDESLAYNVGEIYFSKGRIDEAISYFEVASRIKPDWGKPYIKLGYAYLNKGDLGKAKEHLAKFLELEPESPEATSVKKIIDFIDKQKK